MTTLWGGRFTQKLESAAWDLNSSLPVDQRLALQDVKGSLAWAEALHGAGALTDGELAQIRLGLAEVEKEFSSGRFSFAPSDEDIHTAVERRLTELIGADAGRLHTGRSRNDQVAADFRLWLLEALPGLNLLLEELQMILIEQAERSGSTLMPGYTHLQRAQPVLLAHWWMSHFWPLQRDRERLRDLTRRISVCPLGSGALAGTPVPVDRVALAEGLGFADLSQNSLDAVSDRDFAGEFTFFAALAGVHLSRLAEQIVLYTSAEFGFFELTDSYSTGSSLMPQKRNPDVFELIRGKTGPLIGLLTGLLAMLKSLPSAYDKDLQEDKELVFQAADILRAVLPVAAGAVKTLVPRPERMREAIDSFMMATDLADYLVSKGIPFREAHAISGLAVRAALDRKVGMDELPLEAYQALHPAFGEDVFQVFNPLNSVGRRKAVGGTSPQSVKSQIQLAKSKVKGA